MRYLRIIRLWKHDLSGLFRQFRQTIPSRLISYRFVSFSRNTIFCEMAHLFREITKFLSLPFREISRNEVSLETLGEESRRKIEDRWEDNRNALFSSS